jgi:protein-S-isoprenylcysteine O-methyltransferase Ste14
MSSYAWAAVGAALYVAGLAVLFGMRSWRHRRATGSSGFNGLTHSGGWARAAGMLFAITLIAGAAALSLAALGAVPTLTPPELLQPLALLGLLVAAAGLLLAWAAQSAMGDSWRIGVDPGETTTLVTDGIFSQVRNPIFTAMIATQAGTVLMAPSWLSLAALGLLVVACQLQVRKVEEPYLRATHGPEYLSYTSQAGRFIPILGRHRQPELTPSGKW